MIAQLEAAAWMRVSYPEAILWEPPNSDIACPNIDFQSWVTKISEFWRCHA